MNSLVLLLVVVGVILAYPLWFYNRLVVDRNRMKEGWAEAFESKLAAIRDPRAGSYHPHYYRGYAFTSAAAMTGALGSGLVSNVSSASTAPGSSSGGGGGGSSGGGGGGGGGGGW